MNSLRAEFLVISSLVLVAIALNAIFFAWTLRHNAHLLFLNEKAQHGGDARDFWDWKCVHCGRRMRNKGITISEHATPKGGLVTAVFHSGRPKCMNAYHDYESKAEAIMASWGSGEE